MGKTLGQMLTDIKLDLKDSSYWSTAELTRCIERAVSDLSRFLPEELTYEESLQFTVTGESVTFPAALDVDKIVDAANIAAKTEGDSVSLTTSVLDVPRPLTVSLDPTTGGGIISWQDIIISGVAKDGKAITETFSFGYTNAAKSIVGKEYFSIVGSVVVGAKYTTGASILLDVGTGAYSDTWVYLANKPIKDGSDSGTDNASVAITRDTDYYIDYINGRVKAISGGIIAASEVCTFAYKKMQVGIDLSAIPRLIRVQRVEYPVGQIPQNFIAGQTFGNKFFTESLGESTSQSELAEDEHIRIYYDAEHIPPNYRAPGTIPTYLENTVILAASAYALYIYALNSEHQAVTDAAAARTALGAATTAFTAFGTALTNLKKYLDNNSNADAVGLLAAITTDTGSHLRTNINVALDALNAYLDVVGAATTGDLAKADLVRANYMSTTNYVDGGTAPDVKKYLDDGDATLNTVPVGGQGAEVPLSYATYAKTVREALITPHEQDRSFYYENATKRTNAAMVYAQEAAQRLANLRTFLEQSTGYTSISATFAREAEVRLNGVNSYIQEAVQYTQVTNLSLLTADRFRTEADEKRNEVYSIWRDRRQLIGDFTAGSVRQMPSFT